MTVDVPRLRPSQCHVEALPPRTLALGEALDGGVELLQNIYRDREEEVRGRRLGFSPETFNIPSAHLHSTVNFV